MYCQNIISETVKCFRKVIACDDAYKDKGLRPGKVIKKMVAGNVHKHLSKLLDELVSSDYEGFDRIENDKGFHRNLTWQNFEVFCCYFRALRSFSYGDGQKVRLADLHSGCRLRDDQGADGEGTIVVNRYLDYTEAKGRCDTDSRSMKDKIETCDGDLSADQQLSYVIRNGVSAPAGDFFLSIESPTLGKTVREVEQCKYTEKDKSVAGETSYAQEWEKSAGPDGIFILYTQGTTSQAIDLPNRCGIVDKSCWEEYFGPFAGRAYIAWSYRNESHSKYSPRVA